MGNTCGCVDQAEKDGEVKVENNKLTQHNMRAHLNNYRDSTLSKGNALNTAVQPPANGVPQLFATEDQYLIDLQQNAAE